MRQQATGNRQQLVSDSPDAYCLMPDSCSRGVTILLVVAFVGVFALVLGTVTSYVFQQARYGRALYAREQAISIAEAGLEYYKWFLAHNPAILQNGVGLVSPFTYAVNDPEGGSVGSANITASTALQCNRVQWIDITSRGSANANPGFPRTLNARYMKPSIAEYALVTNSAVWYKSTVTGPVHANIGVHMDGSNNSVVSATQNPWYCSSSYGCNGQGGNPPPGNKPGVFGTGSGFALWRFPAPGIDFQVIAADFPSLKQYAMDSGVMLNPTSVMRAGVQQGATFSSVGGSDAKGFHVVFNADGTVSIYRVTATNSIDAYDPVRGYLYGSGFCSAYHKTYPCDYDYDHPDIAAETLVVANMTLPSGCSIIYSQAKTWLSGTLSGKVTVIGADAGSYNPDIMLGGTLVQSQGNINYATTDGTTGLTAIAERSVRIAYNAPDSMTIRGTFVTQSGSFGRNYYYANPYWNGLLAYRLRNSLTTIGTIVSTRQAGTAWVDSGGNVISGFQNRTTSYDRMQAFTPPPFTPSAYIDYKYTLWREQ